MREIRQSGSEGGEAETNRPSLPLSSSATVKKPRRHFAHTSVIRQIKSGRMFLMTSVRLGFTFSVVRWQTHAYQVCSYDTRLRASVF
jgi:hypothetical protein